jgi:hypothetical protein
VPLPDTAAVPTTCHPAPHDVGALAAGPKTLNVIVPPGEDPPDSTADTADGAIALPDVPDDGALTDNAGWTTVSAMPAPQVELASGLLASPL